MTGWILEIRMFDLKAGLDKGIRYSLVEGLESSLGRVKVETEPKYFRFN